MKIRTLYPISLVRLLNHIPHFIALAITSVIFVSCEQAESGQSKSVNSKSEAIRVARLWLKDHALELPTFARELLDSARVSVIPSNDYFNVHFEGLKTKNGMSIIVEKHGEIKANSYVLGREVVDSVFAIALKNFRSKK